MRQLIVVALVTAIVVALLVIMKPWQHRLEVTADFQDAQGLQAGAPVRIAGVDVGSVTKVRVRPEKSSAPAQVTMILRTRYELRIPKDASVSLQTAGVLGPTFAEIEIAGGSGPPLENGGVLQSKEAVKLTPEQWLERVADIVKQRPCDTLAKSNADARISPDKNSGPDRRK